jgi:energy-coupling factor transporter ATP-binding protein EcfA2
MIRYLSIANFRCIRQAEINLGPFTVLVGPNASGKSTILRALSDIQEELANHWRKDPNARCLLVAQDAQGHGYRYDSRAGGGEVSSGGCLSGSKQFAWTWIDFGIRTALRERRSSARTGITWPTWSAH